MLTYFGRRTAIHISSYWHPHSEILHPLAYPSQLSHSFISFYFMHIGSGIRSHI